MMGLYTHSIKTARTHDLADYPKCKQKKIRKQNAGSHLISEMTSFVLGGDTQKKRERCDGEPQLRDKRGRLTTLNVISEAEKRQ